MRVCNESLNRCAYSYRIVYRNFAFLITSASKLPEKGVERRRCSQRERERERDRRGGQCVHTQMIYKC